LWGSITLVNSTHQQYHATTHTKPLTPQTSQYQQGRPNCIDRTKSSIFGTIVFWLGSSILCSLHDHIAPEKKHPSGVLTKHMLKCRHDNLANPVAFTSSHSSPASVVLVPMRENTVHLLSRPRPPRLRRPEKSQVPGLYGLNCFQLGCARPFYGL
jgi:hypothetical protein